MKGRDRLILMGVIVVAVLGAGWMLVVSPERQKASGLSEQVASAKAQLVTAEGELSKARAAQAQYGKSYASLVSLGKAVPASAETPSLVYEIADAAEHKHVFFGAITASGGPSGAGGGASAAAAAAASSAGFSAMPFTFTFNGSFFNLERLFQKLTSFAKLSSSGTVNVNGRLLTIQNVALTGGGGAPASATSIGKQASKPESELTGTVTATAYVLPGGQTVTGGASPAAPAGTPAAAPAASTAPAASSPTAPATVSVTP